MIDQATREILWNVGSLPNVIAMYLLSLLALVIALAGIWSRIALWSRGTPDPSRPFLSPLEIFSRAGALVLNGLLQRKLVRRLFPALAHTLIYSGFIVLLFTTTMVLIHHDLGIEIYRGRFYLGVTLLSDFFGLAVIIGCALFAHRRQIARPDLLHSRLADIIVLQLLVLLCVQGYLLEGLRIYVTSDPWAAYSPVGNLVSRFFWALSPSAASALHYILWWFHALTVFGTIAYLPYSKLFHILASSFNLFLEKSRRTRGQAPSPGDVAKLMETGDDLVIGTATIVDYSWKQRLDLDACTSCGRCQDVCPAYLTGKPLSPKWLILDTRNHMLALHAKGALGRGALPTPATLIDQELLGSYLTTSGLEARDDHYSYENGGAFRATNELVQGSALKIGTSPDQRIAGEVMDQLVFWSCTTCMACVEACPVGINHVDQIITNRQNLTLMQGELPHEAQQTLRALENRANPYGAPEDRVKWLQDLEVRILTPGDSVDYLYWVGCVSAFDPRKQKIARALVKLMRAAGLSFGILGTAEGCSGDPARRLGEENLFQTLAKSNIETLKRVSFKTLIANCPHCFNTIKNEYPEFGNLGNGRSPEIIHHSVLLKRLVANGQLPLTEGAERSITFHDPCYLGRANGEYDAPRETLKSIKGLKILEMERSREQAMCCGAGGGHFWMDLKIGSRVNAARTDQAAETGASQVATGCPFCLQMMEDGVKLTNRESQLDVKDIAEILAERLQEVPVPNIERASN